MYWYIQTKGLNITAGLSYCPEGQKGARKLTPEQFILGSNSKNHLNQYLVQTQKNIWNTW